MALDDKLVAMFRCPESGGELHYVNSPQSQSSANGGSSGFLFCAESRLKYSVSEDDIPNFLPEDAERLDETAAAALLASLGK